MFNDEFKYLGRTNWEDEECFFKMMDKKGTTDLKHEFKKKKKFFMCIESTPETNPLRKIICENFCIVIY